ncbi:branched-chain amino acid ABC transporter permease, partial [Patescibacteria group bacterium]|nr:branched-chain amino acid ABC transporter permease [Patescibacteria group bacterium]
MNSIIPQIIANSIIAGSLYALVGIGFFMVYRTVKFFDLGYGALTAFGGYMMYWSFKSLGLHSVLSIAIALLLTGLLALCINQLVYKPLRSRKSSNMVLLVASLGVFTALQAVLIILFTSQFKTISISVLQKTVAIFGALVTRTQLVTIVSTFAIFVIIAIVLAKTRFGASIRAVGDDEEVAKIVGVNTRKVVSRVFIISGMIAALAGLLVGLDTGIEPTMGMQLLLKAVVAVIIGGVGRMYGVVIGAFLLAFIENIAVWHLSGEWKDVVAFSVLILFLLFKP